MAWCGPPGNRTARTLSSADQNLPALTSAILTLELW
jgi:hypothetical protein